MQRETSVRIDDAAELLRIIDPVHTLGILPRVLIRPMPQQRKLKLLERHRLRITLVHIFQIPRRDLAIHLFAQRSLVILR